MKILLIDVDSKMPNLALMKISAFHKAQGDSVVLTSRRSRSASCQNPDRVYISCIFRKNAAQAQGIQKMFSCDVIAGGYGLSPGRLPDKIEHLRPDYALYSGVDYSMGFTSRGCSRNCPFCIVPAMEGPIREHAPITEFWDPSHSKIVLLNNNILMSSRAKEKLGFLIAEKLKVSVCQGFDARLITPDLAPLIAGLKSFNWRFTYPTFYTAWDVMKDEDAVLTGIRCLLTAGVKPRYIRPYVLVGFNTTIKQDEYRFKRLRDLGVYPFVMPFDNCDHPMKRWGQRPAYYKHHGYDVHGS